MPRLNDILADKKEPDKKGQYTVQMIHYAHLGENAENKYTTEGIIELANMIRVSGGIKEPVLARKKAPEEYELIAGHRRRLAVKYLVERLGLSEYAYIPVHIEKTSDIMSRINMYITNAGQRNKTDYDRMIEVTGLTESLLALQTGSEEEKKLFCELCGVEDAQFVGGRELRQIVAEKLGLSVTKTAQLKHIENKLDPELKEKFKNQEIGISAANKAAALPPKKQKELIQKEKITIKEVEKDVSESDTNMPGQIDWGSWRQAENQPVPIESHAQPQEPEPQKKGHVLSIGKTEYESMIRGERAFKLVKNDQRFKEDEDLEFWKYDNGMFTGQKMDVRITSMDEDVNGLKDGYCIIGFQIVCYDLE